MKRLVDITHEVHQELERLARYFVACLFEDPFFQQRGCILHRIEYVDELLTVPATHAGEEQVFGGWSSRGLIKCMFADQGNLPLFSSAHVEIGAK